MKRRWLWLIPGLLLIVGDQWLKAIVSSHYALYDTHDLIPHVLEFFYLQNDGAAMGSFSGGRYWLIAVTVVLILGCAAYLIIGKDYSFCTFIGLVLIICGGIGNLIDRIRLGYVIDYMRFPIPWFHYSFNLADCCVCVGAALLVVAFLYDWLIKSKKSESAHES